MIAALLLLAVLFVVLICRQFKVYAQLIDRLRSAGKTREEAKKRLDGYREQAARVSAIVDERAAERWRSAIGQITAVKQLEDPLLAVVAAAGARKKREKTVMRRASALRSRPHGAACEVLTRRGLPTAAPVLAWDCDGVAGAPSATDINGQAHGNRDGPP